MQKNFFIDKNNNKIALVIDFNDIKENAFFTSDSDEFQVGFQYHPNEKIIEKHVHNEIKRSIKFTSEFIFVINGKVKAEIFDEYGVSIGLVNLTDNQALLQYNGGHSFVIAPGTKFFEIKQGPYFGKSIDKKYEITSK